MLLLVAPAQFGADVELEVPSDCTAAFADFHARLSASVVGTPSNNRRARVVIDRSGSRPVIIVQGSVLLGQTILIESGLSYLGLGAQPPLPSWGNMVVEGRQFLASAWWIAAFPGLAIFLAVLGFNLFGDGLRDALDPALRGSS